MKNFICIIFLAVFLVSQIGFAEVNSSNENDYRELATTQWQLTYKDGVPQCAPPPVVKRKRKKKVIPIVKETFKKCPVCEVPVTIHETETKFVEEPYYRNRISLLPGAGPYFGGYLNKSVTTVSMGVNYLPMVGVSYERLLNRRWSLTGGVFTNGSFYVGVGIGF